MANSIHISPSHILLPFSSFPASYTGQMFVEAHAEDRGPGPGLAQRLCQADSAFHWLNASPPTGLPALSFLQTHTFSPQLSTNLPESAPHFVLWDQAEYGFFSSLTPPPPTCLKGCLAVPRLVSNLETSTLERGWGRALGAWAGPVGAEGLREVEGCSSWLFSISSRLLRLKRPKKEENGHLSRRREEERHRRT